VGKGGRDSEKKDDEMMKRRQRWREKKMRR
jgi:hypothetical protein